MQTIVTLTLNSSIDTSSSVANVVAEHKLRCKPPRFEPGSGGINVSRAIQRLGGESVALYLAGGPTGQMIQKLLDAEGLNHRPIAIEGWSRESFSVLEETTGQEYRFSMPGPTLHEEEWQRCLDDLAAIDVEPAYIVASGSLPPGAPSDFYARVTRTGNELGARVIVDTSGEAFCEAVRHAGIYLIKPNLRELGQLAGRELVDEAELEAVAKGIVERGQSEVVVVSLGAAGALLVSKEGCKRLRPPTVPIRSKVGAGDSMVAGIVLSLARGMSLREAVQFGIAAGAAAVMTPGTELCRHEDTERLYHRMRSETA